VVKQVKGKEFGSITLRRIGETKTKERKKDREIASGCGDRKGGKRAIRAV